MASTSMGTPKMSRWFGSGMLQLETLFNNWRALIVKKFMTCIRVKWLICLSPHHSTNKQICGLHQCNARLVHYSGNWYWNENTVQTQRRTQSNSKFSWFPRRKETKSSRYLVSTVLSTFVSTLVVYSTGGVMALVIWNYFKMYFNPGSSLRIVLRVAFSGSPRWRFFSSCWQPQNGGSVLDEKSPRPVRYLKASWKDPTQPGGEDTTLSKFSDHFEFINHQF